MSILDKIIAAWLLLGFLNSLAAIYIHGDGFIATCKNIYNDEYIPYVFGFIGMTGLLILGWPYCLWVLVLSDSE